jgi:hypothetical protein
MASEKGGAPGRVRTCNLLIRSQKLCPIELRVLREMEKPAAETRRRLV